MKNKEEAEQLWVGDGETEIPAPSSDFSASLGSLSFISSALRRTARFWVAMAAIGLLVGIAVNVALPPAHRASTSLLLTNGAEAAPEGALADDQAIVESRTVGALALRELRLNESVNTFLKSYTATVVTDRVLLITVSAPSSNDAVSRARAIAAAFLAYRTRQLYAQQNLVFASLAQQVNQASDRVTSINQQILMATQPETPSQQATLASLRSQHAQATKALATLQQSVNQIDAATREATTSEIDGSQVLDAAAPIPPSSQRKHLLLDASVGLIAGLVLGLAIVVVRAFTSERTYRRDDVALALGAPVALSVGTVPPPPLRRAERDLASPKSHEIQRIVGFLARAVPNRPAAALALVPADDTLIAARVLVSLAVSSARDGRRVVLVDLVSGAPAGRLVGARRPGIHEVSVLGTEFAVGIPAASAVPPVGPRSSQGVPCRGPDDLAAGCASADVVLTLATLHPSIGGEHLATWTDDAVVMITAGRSTWTKIHSVGEMIRLARVRLVSGVLVKAAKTDESLGSLPRIGADRAYSIWESETDPRANPW